MFVVPKQDSATDEGSGRATNHHFVKNGSGAFAHFIEFINAANASISEHQCSTECSQMNELIWATATLTFGEQVDWSLDLWSRTL
jgi:hypothetical protein